jgi:hypothetical protein
MSLPICMDRSSRPIPISRSLGVGILWLLTPGRGRKGDQEAGMEHLRCKPLELARSEPPVHLLAYDLTRVARPSPSAPAVPVAMQALWILFKRKWVRIT